MPSCTYTNVTIKARVILLDFLEKEFIIKIYQFILTTYENLFVKSLTMKTVLRFLLTWYVKKCYLLIIFCTSPNRHKVEEYAFVSEPFVFPSSVKCPFISSVHFATSLLSLYLTIF